MLPSLYSGKPLPLVPYFLLTLRPVVHTYSHHEVSLFSSVLRLRALFFSPLWDPEGGANRLLPLLSSTCIQIK